MKIYNVGELSPPQSFLDQQSSCGDTWLVTDYWEFDGLPCGTAVSLNEQELFVFSFYSSSDPIDHFDVNRWAEERKHHSGVLVSKVDELIRQSLDTESTGKGE